MDKLTRTWLTLIALILATVSLAPFGGRIASAGLLALAFLKARTILGRFLHLDGAPGWLSVATVPLAIWLIVLWGLNAVALR
ncbi:cytochrome C oxidase subunit IV family protein [Paracoccus marinaquae]|uniref:Cytochrome C oxidase subunit IV family protein n=1 Tax=Paracoccus marinaquae TaxID=2841926 RepID=A0ABS6AJ02_9RHOB|nr:cytochrome C oxidase subunit IV family protein [Paracoccus marinaquae]MBU3030575.1 cytochrome C oxidase subunit IV family protein [Paracoccus marinaquae]